jgi:hypothetical protein
MNLWLLMLECKNGEVQSEKLFGEKLILLTGIGPNDASALEGDLLIAHIPLVKSKRTIEIYICT